MTPQAEQYETAIRETHKLVEQFRRLPGCVTYRPDLDRTPAAVMQWMNAHAEEMTARTFQHCGHGNFSQPMFVFGTEPNVGRCARCNDARSAKFAAAVQVENPSHFDCDLCGIPESALTLAVVVFPVAAILVRAFACNRCLNSN